MKFKSISYARLYHLKIRALSCSLLKQCMYLDGMKNCNMNLKYLYVKRLPITSNYYKPM